MPIMAAHAQSDARAAAWLLVSATLRCIDDPGGAPDWQDALNNTYRLLEAFRHNIFFGLRPPVSRQVNRGGVDLLTVSPSNERHLSDVRDALDRALTISFGAESKGGAVERIENVLRAVAYPDKFKSSEEDVKLAKRFFEELRNRLV